MKDFVIDFLYIRTVEKQLKRRLTSDELEQVSAGEIIFVQLPDTSWFSFVVPTYIFPNDLTTQPVDPRTLYLKTRDKNLFEYVDEVGFTGNVLISKKPNLEKIENPTKAEDEDDESL